MTSKILKPQKPGTAFSAETNFRLQIARPIESS
jgi:hypothetical protein